METLKLKINKITTRTEDNRFERAKDLGSSGIFSAPKQFVVCFECETVVERNEEFEGKKPEKVYFTHRFNFSETMSKHGGMTIPEKKESDFVLFIEGQKKEHIGGLRMDEEYFTLHGSFLSKFQEGEEIRVKGTAERKASKVGNEYIQMKRVKLDKSYYYHS